MQTVSAKTFMGNAVSATRPVNSRQSRRAVAVQASAATAFNTKRSEEVRG